MDVTAIVTGLKEHRDRIQQAIDALETTGSTTAVNNNVTPMKRRGRRKLTDAEKRAHSKRMKAYWAEQRRKAA